MGAEVFRKYPFLDSSETKAIKSVLEANSERGFFGKDDQLIGAPVDAYEKQVDNHEEATRQHNDFMMTNFAGLLEKTRVFLEEKTGRTCFYGNSIGLPGFRIFKIPPETQRSLWFHFDLLHELLIEQYPEFGITKASRLYTFIVLLDAPEGLTSGLLYFPENELGKKIMNYKVGRHGEFQSFAKQEIYSLGEMNVFEEVIHSIYANNESTSTLKRMTLQGHFVETPRGYLIFW